MFKKNGIVFFCKMTHLKFVFVVLIIASAQVVQVIKVDILSPDIIPMRTNDKSKD